MTWNEFPLNNVKELTKKKKTNINAFSRRCFEQMGWRVGLTQSFNFYSNKSNDLFGFADLIMFIPEGIDVVLVQACHMSSRAARVKKILANEIAYDWLRATPHRHIWVHAWRKLRREVYDKHGKISKRIVWTHDIRIIHKEDFNICQLSNCQDVDFKDVEIEAMVEAHTAPSITGSENVSDTEKKIVLKLVTPFIKQDSGKT